MRNLPIIAFLYCCATLLTNAQHSYNSDNEKPKHTYLSARLHGGIVVPHHTNMMYFINDFSRGFEITYGRAFFSTDSWESYFNYPEIGLGLYYETFGNKDIYGIGLALFPYINYNVYRNPKFSLQNKVSLGLGYATKPYNKENNEYNTVFSSHLNAYIGFALIADYRLNKNFSLSLSTALSHLSNGASSKPNNGINTLTAAIGTKYHFNKAPTPILEKVKAPKCNTKDLIIVGSIGRSQSSAFNASKYWNGSLSVNYLWYLNKKRAIGIGFDQFYSQAAPYSWEAYESNSDLTEYNLRHYLFNGVFASYNVFLDRTTLFVNVGAYLCTKIKPPQPVYPRLGIRHYVSKNLVANFSIKASFFRSEFMEFGLGYRISNLFEKQ